MTDMNLPPQAFTAGRTQARLPSPSILPTQIFNAAKGDYHVPEIILGEAPGLLDSIHTHHPKLFALYKTLKKLDWDELEFPFEICQVEFADGDQKIADKMIKTLAWQWEADSIASRSIVNVLSCVVTDSRVWTGYVRINDNENVHALTYSEIVRCSFKDPKKVVDELMQVEEAQKRLVVVAEIMATAHEMAHRYALGEIPNDQTLYNAIFMYLVALYFLERVQFMASFAITFAIGKAGNFQVISEAVKKIAQDEFEIHSQYGQEVLRALLKTERGKLAYEQCREQIIQLGIELLWTETRFVNWMFADGTQLVGAPPTKLIQWNQFNCKAAFSFLDVDGPILERAALPYKEEFGIELTLPETNPLPFMVEYLDIAATQNSPQETDAPDYQVNLLDRQGVEDIIDVDDL